LAVHTLSGGHIDLEAYAAIFGLRAYVSRLSRQYLPVDVEISLDHFGWAEFIGALQ